MTHHKLFPKLNENTEILSEVLTKPLSDYTKDSFFYSRTKKNNGDRFAKNKIELEPNQDKKHYDKV